MEISMGTFIAFGYGPGISHATAQRFAREGYTIALVGRSTERLADGVARFKADGIVATAYEADASDPALVREAVARIRKELGPISAVLWTAFRGGAVRNVLDTAPEDVTGAFGIGVSGLLACTQAALDDLKSSTEAAILVANGALGDNTSQADAYAKMLNNDGVALENAAKSKLVGILAERLRDDGIYVGEVTIVGSVKGTATAISGAIEPSKIADLFWSLTRSRDKTRVRISE
jgi:NAD(P)-dependent dehydrogenase (short-subunit alcohol dehydrogenase family)